MTPKFIEISSGENLPPTRFEIVEVQKDNFMLKTKNSHIGLLGNLEKWIESNKSIGESSYTEML
jgi:WD40 repeat protein